MEKAYPKIKPQEYVNELKRIAPKNNIEVNLLFEGNNSYLVQNSYIDDIAQGFGEELSMIFYSIY